MVVSLCLCLHVAVFFFLFVYYVFGCAGSLLMHSDFFLIVVNRGYFLVVHRLLIAVASLVAEHGL